MPKKINDGVKARGLRLLAAHAREYSSVSAAAEAIAGPADDARPRCGRSPTPS